MAAKAKLVGKDDMRRLMKETKAKINSPLGKRGEREGENIFLIPHLTPSADQLRCLCAVVWKTKRIEVLPRAKKKSMTSLLYLWSLNELGYISQSLKFLLQYLSNRLTSSLCSDVYAFFDTSPMFLWPTQTKGILKCPNYKMRILSGQFLFGTEINW